MLIRRKTKEGKLAQNDEIFQILPVVPLIEVSKIEAQCTSITTDCTIMRTRERLPEFLTDDDGPIIRNIYSLDTSEEVIRTSLQKWLSVAKSTYFKYNTKKYFWYRDGYLYFPNVKWSNVHVEALFVDEVSGYCIEDSEGCYTCGGSVVQEKMQCTLAQDTYIPYPKDLVAEIESMIKNDMAPRIQIPSDTQDNSQNQMR
jgi:hypothetical protein